MIESKYFQIPGKWENDLMGCPSQCYLEIWIEDTPYVIYLRWRHCDPWTLSLIDSATLKDFVINATGEWVYFDNFPFFKEEDNLDAIQYAAVLMIEEYFQDRLNPFKETGEEKPVISWENKAKMCQLANESRYSDFETFVLEHVETFDQQAWDMFINSVNINIKDIQKPTDFWSKMKPYFMPLDGDAAEISWRTQMRVKVIQAALYDPPF